MSFRKLYGPCQQCGVDESSQWRKVDGKFWERLSGSELPRLFPRLSKGSVICNKDYTLILRTIRATVVDVEQQLIPEVDEGAAIVQEEGEAGYFVRNEQNCQNDVDKEIPADQEAAHLLGRVRELETRVSELEDALKTEREKNRSYRYPLHEVVTDIVSLFKSPPQDLDVYNYDSLLAYSQDYSPILSEFLMELLNASSETSDNISLLKYRLVTICHILAYNKNQKVNILQSAVSSLFSGVSDLYLHVLHRLGVGVSLRKVYYDRKVVSMNHFSNVCSRLESINAKEYFGVATGDDFHNIHSSRAPDTTSSTDVSHMGTSAYRVCPNVPRVAVAPSTKYTKDDNPAYLKPDVLKLQLGNTYSFHLGLSHNEWKLHFNESLHSSISTENISLHSYDPFLKERKQDRSMQNVFLLDCSQNPLKSKEDYVKLFDHSMSNIPIFSHILTENIVPFVADWPGFSYVRRLIMMHCTGHYRVPEELLHLRPFIGPLHLSLNGREFVFLKYRDAFFAPLYAHLFGEKAQLATKPKPWRISLLLAISCEAWNAIRDDIKGHFGKCKDPSYLYFLNLLDNYIPMMLDIYSQYFRGGDLKSTLSVVFRAWTFFFASRRPNYKRAPLAFLSDLLDRSKPNHPEHGLYQAFAIGLPSITDYDPEHLHSRIRAAIKEYFDADRIQNVARQVEVHRHSSDLLDHFGPTSQVPYTKEKVTKLSLLAIDFLAKIFHEVAHNLGKSKYKAKEKIFHLHGAPVAVPLHTMPLGYALVAKEKEFPSKTKECDNSTCKKIGQGHEIAQLICGHSYHHGCTPQDTNSPLHQCLNCFRLLAVAIDAICKQFNKALKTSGTGSIDPEEEEEEIQVQEEDGDEFLEVMADNEHCMLTTLERLQEEIVTWPKINPDMV